MFPYHVYIIRLQVINGTSEAMKKTWQSSDPKIEQNCISAAW